MAKKSFQDLQKSMVAFDRGSSPRVREMTRDAFFDGRQDVSADRLARRAFQEQRTTDFKNKYTKQVPNTGGTLLEMTPDAPRSLAAERERLAKAYGPTFKEIGSDIGFGLGRIAQDLQERGAPLFRLLGGLKNTFFPPKPTVTYGGNITAEVIDESPQFVPPTFNDQKININRLDSIFPPSEMDDETFNNEILRYLYPEISFAPFRIQNMNLTGDGLPQLYANLNPNRMFKKGGPVDKYSGLGYKLR